MENSHHAFVFGQQYGGDFRDSSGKPQFDRPGAVAGIKRYLDLMAFDKIVNPSNAEYAANQSLSDFANGRASMLMWQAAELLAAGIRPFVTLYHWDLPQVLQDRVAGRPGRSRTPSPTSPRWSARGSATGWPTGPP